MIRVPLFTPVSAKVVKHARRLFPMSGDLIEVERSERCALPDAGAPRLKSPQGLFADCLEM